MINRILIFLLLSAVFASAAPAKKPKQAHKPKAPYAYVPQRCIDKIEITSETECEEIGFPNQGIGVLKCKNVTVHYKCLRYPARPEKELDPLVHP